MRYLLMTRLEKAGENSYDVDVYDPQSIDWSKFLWTQGYYKHHITKFEIIKSYLISYKYYGVVDYDDIILMLNGIKDVFELPPGTEIKVPKIEELRNFILEYKK